MQTEFVVIDSTHSQTFERAVKADEEISKPTPIEDELLCQISGGELPRSGW